MQRSIAKNTAYMTTASIFQKVVAFVYFTYVARTIGVEDMGKYTLALSFTTIFVVFVDLGFTNVLIREAARYRDRLQAYFSTVLSIKFIFGILTYGAAIVTVHLMGYEAEIRHLVYLSAVTMLFDSFHLSVYGTIRSIGDLRWEAAAMFGSQVTTLILGVIFLQLGLPLIYLILAFTIPSGINLLYSLTVARVQFGVYFRPKYDKAIFKALGIIAIPFAITAIFSRVYSYIDAILLSKLVDTASVGLYSIATKITFSFQFLPLALLAAIYPRFSEYFQTDKQRLAFVFERSLKYLWILAFPIAVGVGVIAQDVVLLLYTDKYMASILPLQILIASLVFSFISFPIGAMLNACNKQVTQTVIVGCVMVANIVLNLLLIPIYGIVGAAIAAFIGNTLLSIAGYIIVPKITTISHGFLAKTLLQLIISAGVMGIAVYYVSSIHLFAAITAGIVIYPIMLFATGCVNRHQLEEAFQMVKR